MIRTQRRVCITCVCRVWSCRSRIVFCLPLRSLCERKHTTKMCVCVIDGYQQTLFSDAEITRSGRASHPHRRCGFLRNIFVGCTCHVRPGRRHRRAHSHTPTHDVRPLLLMSSHHHLRRHVPIMQRDRLVAASSPLNMNYENGVLCAHFLCILCIVWNNNHHTFAYFRAGSFAHEISRWQ